MKNTISILLLLAAVLAGSIHLADFPVSRDDIRQWFSQQSAEGDAQPPAPSKSRDGQGTRIAAPTPAPAPAPQPTPRPAVDTVVVDLPLVDSGFKPVSGNSRLGAYNPGTVECRPSPPPGIGAEPDYIGSWRCYADLQLGTRQPDRYLMVLDLPRGANDFSEARIHLDANGNRDLTDDGQPYTPPARADSLNATLGIPAPWLYRQSVPWMDDIKLRLFGGGYWWKQHKLSLRTDSQLVGEVPLGEQSYPAVLAEVLTNNADFVSHTFLYLDLDRDGSFDRDSEGFALNEVHVIDGKRYQFRVHW